MEATITLKVEFEHQNPEKEDQIRQRCGWYLEYKASGLCYYPPDWLHYGDKSFVKIMGRKVKDWVEKTQDVYLYVILHNWEPIDGGDRKTYYSNMKNKIGEAEYFGRKAGAEIHETENCILRDIRRETEQHCQSAIVINSKTYAGDYYVPFKDVTDEDRKALGEIKKCFNREYPNDIFIFTELREVPI